MCEQELFYSKGDKVIKYLIVLFVVLLTDTISIPAFRTNMCLVLIALAAMLAYAMHLFANGFIISKEEALNIEGVVFFCVLSQVVNQDYSFAYENKIAITILGFCIVKNIPFIQFKKIYIDIICFIAALTIVVYISTIMGFSWWENLPLVGDDNYHTLIFDVIPPSGQRYRVYGPFWEPGVFQAYLNVALLFSLLQRQIDIKRVILILICILLTFSTTGYICTALIFLIRCVDSDGTTSIRSIILIMAGLLLLIFLINNSYVMTVVFGKFSNSASSYGSLAIRLKDISIYANEYLKNPIFGTGLTKSYNNAVKQYSLNVMYRNFAGSASTSMREFAGIGIYVGVLRLVQGWKFCEKISRKHSTAILMFLLFLIILNTEDYIYSLMFSTLFFYGIVDDVDNIRNKIKFYSYDN